MSGEKSAFSRRQRLLQAAEFEAVFAHRCSWRTPLFQILARPNNAGHARLGMVVSKRLLSRAVDRNLVRRKIREVFRHMAPDLPALDLVVRPLALPASEQPESTSSLKPVVTALQKSVKKTVPKKAVVQNPRVLKKTALKKTLSRNNAAWVEALQGALVKASEKCCG